MKSGKQRRLELKAERQKKEVKKLSLKGGEKRKEVPSGIATCNPEKLAPYNSYGEPVFVTRGYYSDIPFQCQGCGVKEVWRATQQKWWYEVAKGNVESTATRCRLCRRKERERKACARKASEEGMEKKRVLQT
jgi:hypothetical protein